ncbi:hypothetical protein [Paradevosia shaoguanensis]|uniref:Antirepressor protein C-terminal domain-containing protein n=1 Tax=Paradevosia shaoguanensis TaxID=1335043 RepID=A0AA41QRE9_9HYPH|nr:hypothetical protein [Paradevosia shaoguanensis]MCF1744705.1 hypothetical protein [Paradevosia shaoguanensis]MCI0129188.1 hypothetical protein [Paradevosia shaoguanensis]
MPEHSGFEPEKLPVQTGNVPDIDLNEIDGEPRFRDLDLADRLGFSRSRSIRQLIERNRVEIEAFGPLATQRGKSRGQEFMEYWLNEEQGLLVATLSDAERAPDVRHMLIKVFVAWRRGHLAGTDSVDFTDYRAAREHRLQFAQNLKMAALIGLKGSEAAIAANQATARATGFDTLAAMGVKHLVAPQNDALVVPSDIGQELGISAQQVNHLLEAHGLQESKRTRKGRSFWVPTKKGEQHGGTMVVVQRAHDVTGSARQLKWPSSIVSVVRGLMIGEPA